MRLRPTPARIALPVALTLVLLGIGSPPPLAPFREEREEAKIPSDWFLLQRAWPYPDIRQSSRLAAWEQARRLREESLALRGAGGTWVPEGPTNVGGRIVDVVCHPTDPDVCWVGAAEGGVMKTTDGGQTWIPTMDFESSLSIGDLALDPSDPQVLYVGTGEPNGGGGSVTYGGTGVFKSIDGGLTWTNVGLPESRHIGRVVVDPNAPGRVFVAVLGTLWSTSPERGLYRSTDAGGSWQQVLALTDSTGAVDVAVHPTTSSVVYAAMWERIREPNRITYGGPNSGLWRSLDGGDTWSQLGNGLPSGAVGRIGIAVTPDQPDWIYAVYSDAAPGSFLGVFKSTDRGSSWTQTNDSALADVFASYGWWFSNIRVDPNDADRVFVLGLDFYRSQNGGGSWQETSDGMHVDHHGLDFGPGVIYEGNDGGMYVSDDNGSHWTKLPDLPATQFYAIDVDHQNPWRLYGGAQDNGTNRTLTGAVNDWEHILGGDGFRPNVDPVNNAYVYAEYQGGSLYRSTNGGGSFTSAQSGLSGRRNWSMPVELDPSNPATLYCGSNYVFRSTNRAASWSAISPDLSNGPGGGNQTFGTITTIAVAETDPNVIWAGLDDSNVWVTTNGGTSWARVDAGLPDRWITRVAVDPTAADVSYVTVSGFRWEEPLPHVFRSTDFGASWTDISSNLPEAPVNDIVVDPQSSSVLYVATDFGVYWSTDLGGSWSMLGSGLPNVVVNDLELHDPTRTLVAGTYGRSMWSLDLATVTAAAELVPGNPAGDGLRLEAPRPNPLAGGRVTVRYFLPRESAVSLRVLDVSGRLVAVLEEGRRAAGEGAATWDGRDGRGRRVAAGAYFLRLEADGASRTRKLTVLR